MESMKIILNKFNKTTILLIYKKIRILSTNSCSNQLASRSIPSLLGQAPASPPPSFFASSQNLEVAHPLVRS